MYNNGELHNMSEMNGTISMDEVRALAESPNLPTRTTDPQTRLDMAWQILRSTEPEEVEQPKPDKPLEQAPAKPPVRPPLAPRMARAWLWLIAQVQTPYRIKRAVIALLRAPAKAWGFIKVVSSVKVTPERKAERDAACAECPFRHYRIRKSKGEFHLDEHCSKCGCPDWKMSRNNVRNWYSDWLCPARRHPGPYPDDALRESIKGHGYDPESVFGGGTGCSGCGCGKAGAGK